MARHLTVARIAEGLSVARDTADDAVLAEGKRALLQTQTDAITSGDAFKMTFKHT